MTEITLIKNINATELLAKNNVDDILSKIKKEIDNFATDITTEKGRKELKSFVHTLARSKTTLDGMGKELVSGWKEKSKLVDNERKKIRDTIENWQVEVRKPLTDFENAEAERVKLRNDRIELIKFAVDGISPELLTSHLVKQKIQELQKLEKFDWQEFEAKAGAEYEKSYSYLHLLLENTLIQEEKKKEEERVRIAREKEEKLAREKRIAEEATREAEKIAEEQKLKLIAEQKRKEEEAQAKIEKAKIEKEKAEQNLIQEKKLAQEREKQAELKAKLEKEELLKRERERVEAVKRQEEEAQAKREADKEHRAGINNEVLDSIVSHINGMCNEESVKLSNKCSDKPLEYHIAKLITSAIASNRIPHTKINY